MPNGKTKTYTLNGQTYTVPADTSMDELDAYIRSQSATTQAPKPKPQGLLGRAEKWWTTPTPDVSPNPALRSEEATLPYSTSPQQSFRRGSAILAGEGLPAALAAPAATVLGLGGGLAGSTGGRYLGEKVGAPELGSDIGGLTGAIFGGSVGSRASSAAGDYLAPKMRWPATPGQAVLGKPGTVKNILPPMMQKWMLPEWAIPKGELGTPTNPGQFSRLPAKLPPNLRSDPFEQFTPQYPGASQPSASEFYENRGADLMKRPDPLTEAVKQGIAVRLPSRMPIPAPIAPSPFGGMTSSATPLGNEPLPPLGSRTSVLGNKPNVEMVGKFQKPPSGVTLVPEPRELTPADRPGSKYSIPRKDLPGLARRGEPGAADVLRNVQGKPLLYTPREGVGYPSGPKVGMPENPFSPEPSQIRTTPFSLRPEVQEMATRSKAMQTPEWLRGQTDLEIKRLSDILRDPSATAEERSIARSQLENYQRIARRSE